MKTARILTTLLILTILAVASLQPVRQMTAESGEEGLLDVYVTHIFDPKEDRPDFLFRNLGGTQ